ncbi:FAD-binding oxidoreductase [Novosphingobium sp. BL-52-GroH]|uniref:FAD-binding oxidoreductase n=1 Tax=Novosphingobium sp. BL-52-GroH TaxID=3349877 RepID=UPI00384EA097
MIEQIAIHPAGDTITCDHDLIGRFKALLGDEAVLLGEADRRFFSEDVYQPGVMPLAALQASSVEEVQGIVRLCAEHGVAIVPRGGGMSYTGGYLPVRPRSVSIDTRGLDRIVEIRPDDMVVTVEAGCTWSELRTALAAHGLRTPYWGPVSGHHATVGGAMSQNSAFWGAVPHGTAAENVLGMDVVLADGTLLSTGARGGLDGDPAFYRHHGPELTGLFTGDCGAFGIKVRVTLPLIDAPSHHDVASFGFEDPFALLAAVSEMGRRELICEGAIFDQGQQDARVSEANIPLRQMMATFWSVLKRDGVGAALRMAAAGQRFLKGVSASAHLTIEGPSREEIERKRRAVEAIAARQGGWSIEPTIARALAANPFPMPDTMLSTLRFVPVHGLLPHSLAPTVYRQVLDLFEHYKDEAALHGVKTGVFSVPVGNSMILIEPTWHWSSAFLASHPRLFGKAESAMPAVDANPEGDALVMRMRAEVTTLFRRAGAVNFQMGKHYPFQQSRQPANLDIIAAFKQRVDPQGIMNPGALGFGN